MTEGARAFFSRVHCRTRCLTRTRSRSHRRRSPDAISSHARSLAPVRTNAIRSRSRSHRRRSLSHALACPVSLVPTPVRTDAVCSRSHSHALVSTPLSVTRTYIAMITCLFFSLVYINNTNKIIKSNLIKYIAIYLLLYYFKFTI